VHKRAISPPNRHYLIELLCLWERDEQSFAENSINRFLIKFFYANTIGQFFFNSFIYLDSLFRYKEYAREEVLNSQALGYGHDGLKIV